MRPRLGDRVGDPAAGASPRSRARVLLVDDHRLFADLIKLILEDRGFEVVGVATTAGEAMEMVGSQRPAMVLVDIRLPDQSGLTLGARILEELPDALVVGISALDDPASVEEAARLGFHGYLSKDMHRDKFVDALRSILEGRVVISRVTAPVRSAESKHAALLARQLTAREREVLGLLAQGASSGEMTKRLGVSPNTIRTHVQNILTKLGAHSRLEVAAFAVRHGLVVMGRGGSGSEHVIQTS